LIRKPKIDTEAVATVRADIASKVARAYQFVFIAWLIGTFQVELRDLQISGVSITLNNPDTAIGMLLFFVLLVYIYVFARLLADSVYIGSNTFSLRRALFFNALSSHKMYSLRNLDGKDLRSVKTLTRRYFMFSAAIYSAYGLLPLLVAIVFSRYIVVAAKFLFSS
jgi:hypothetical protein